jgi:hypothetical protein
MPTFIKAGLWAKKKLGFLGELNLDHLITTITGTSIGPNGTTVYGDIIPSLDDTYTLGNAQFRWKSLHLGEGTLYITDTVTGNDAAITVTDGVLFINDVSSLAINSVKFSDDTVQNTAYIPPVAQSFNPLFTDGSGTLAGVTATGSYTMIAPNICYYRIHVDFANCTNFGTLGYQVTLPFASINTMREANGSLHQLTGNSLYHIAGIVDGDSGSNNIMKFYYSGSTTDLVWKYNTPVASTTVTSHFDISGTYEIA